MWKEGIIFRFQNLISQWINVSANFSDEGAFILRSSHDSLCTDPPPVRIFPEGRRVCTQATPVNAQFRHEYIQYCFSFPCVICLIGRSIKSVFFEVFSWNTWSVLDRKSHAHHAEEGPFNFHRGHNLFQFSLSIRKFRTSDCGRK